LEVGVYCFSRVFLFEGSEEVGLGSILAGLINSKGFLAVPLGLGSTLEDAGHFLNFGLVIPGGNGGSNFNSLDESALGGGILETGLSQ